MNKKYNADCINSLNSTFCRKYKICVIYHDRGKTPRFHVIDTKTKGYQFDCQISLLTLKQLKGDHLNSNMYRKLLEFLKTKNEIFYDTKKDKLWDLKCEWCASNRVQINMKEG